MQWSIHVPTADRACVDASMKMIRRNLEKWHSVVEERIVCEANPRLVQDFDLIKQEGW